MVLFEMKNIKKSFGSLEVLKDISLQVEEGEVLSIIGPSGSGKSTLLRCATGLETPDSGEIIKQGDVGLVFQNFNLFPHFSVLKNITATIPFRLLIFVLAITSLLTSYFVDMTPILHPRYLNYSAKDSMTNFRTPQ